MTPKLAAFIEQGKTLSAEERLEAARQLLLSVDSDTGRGSVPVDPAWRTEIESRLVDVVAGKVELVDANETYDLLTAELSAKQG